MNQEEKDKFDDIIEKGFGNLIETRPGKPMHSFIHYLWNGLSPELQEKNKKLKDFCTVYGELMEDAK
jgi:hypothetical protein